MPRLLRTVGRTAVVAGTASAVSGRVHKRQYDKWADQEQQQYDQQVAQQQPAAQQAAQQQAAAPSSSDTMDKLAELAKMHEAGVIDDAEFKAAKAKALGI